MSIERRDFLKTFAAGAVLPTGEVLDRATEAAQRIRAASLAADLYDRSIVIDTLAVGLEWDEVEFEAAALSGYTGIQTTLPSGNFDQAMRALAAWNARIEEHPEALVRATGAADIERAKAEGKMAVIFGFQNATMIHDDLDNIDLLYAEGTRCIQLTYNSRNLLGDGCTERTNAGLSDFGVAAVKRMNELGIIVDLSHCGRQTIADGLAFSDPPACFTHTMCEALRPGHPRAKTDAQLRAVAEQGGVASMVTIGYFVGNNPGPGGTTTIETYLDHIDHAVNVAGIDHVGVASDYQLRGISSWATRENWYEPRLKSFKPSYDVQWPPWIPELDGPERFRTVTAGLQGRGYSDDQIEKILGLNWMGYFREVLRG
jgi:membrane dipeptidase